MIKRTIAIENPCKLSIKDRQLLIEKNGGLAGKIPVEDIGVLLVDHPAVLYTHACFTELLENNCAVVLSGKNHHPNGLLLPLDGNSVQSERFRHQVESSLPLKKQLWRQTIRAKIRNQALHLQQCGAGAEKLFDLSQKVKSGDSDNLEAQSARYYWPRIFGSKFSRDRNGKPPNNMLNYGYTVLRAGVARALVSAGLLPTLGIHHRSRYNAFCLADDIMEPFRPYVDKIVFELREEHPKAEILTTEIKQSLLSILTIDAKYKNQTRPLMLGLHQTAASLYRCFAGEQKSIDYPEL